MPEMGGMEAAERIRAEIPLDRQPKAIVALTANAFKECATRYLMCGMNDVLTKPYVALYYIYLTSLRIDRNELSFVLHKYCKSQ
jgi:CheY-like chemotaxis protein